jgi:hypothetical protein
MANKSEPHSALPPEATFAMQKTLLNAYEEIGGAWIERVKAEVALWSDLAAKLSASRTMPDGLQACQDTFAQRMQMVADDGRRLFEDSQKIITSISRTMPNGWPKQNTE